MSEPAPTDPSVPSVESASGVEAEQQQQSDESQETTEPVESTESAEPIEQSEATEQTDRPTTDQTDNTGGDSPDTLETATEGAEAAEDGADTAESGEEVKYEGGEEEDDNGDDEPQLVEADDEMPQRAEAEEGGGEDGAEAEQAQTEAEKEIERYNELVKQAGEQQLTLQTGEEEHDNGGHDTARSTATDMHAAAAAATALSSPNTKAHTATTDNTASASHSPHSARQPLQISSPAAANDDDIPSPLSPSSPSSSSPAVRSWSDVEAAKAECDHLLHLNKTRQRHIALILDAERRQNHPSLAVAAAAAQQSTDGATNEPIKTDYIKLLTQLSNIWDDVNQQQNKSETAIARLLDKLNEQDKVGEEMQDSLRAFIIEMARNATDKRGNTAPVSKYERLLVDEAKVSRQLADVRLLYLQQQGQMDSIQHEIKQKEELAEGLHLIDFEQLKIENATLHEKIEERNDEIYKLTKKKHNCIEVLTHVREKVWYVWHENQLLHDKVSDMDDAILRKRKILKKLKQQREVLRKQNELLKTKEGFVGVDALVMDFEKRKELVTALRERIEAKRLKWEQLTRAKERRVSAGRQNQRGGKSADEAESKEQSQLWAQTRVVHRLSR